VPVVAGELEPQAAIVLAAATAAIAMGRRDLDMG
jgi:hypothetical protein